MRQSTAKTDSYSMLEIGLSRERMTSINLRLSLYPLAFSSTNFIDVNSEPFIKILFQTQVLHWIMSLGQNAS